MKALPIRPRPLLSWAREYACLSRRRLSSSLRVTWRRWAAALAPGPSWASRSSRHIAWLLTTTTLKARLISPITFPSMPSASPSHPAALPILAHLVSAKMRKSWWKSEDMSPQGPTTSLPSSRPPKFLNLERRGPAGGSGWPRLTGEAPRNLTSRC